jgi:hypothetical protein
MTSSSFPDKPPSEGRIFLAATASWMMITIAGYFYYFDRQFVPWPQVVLPSGVVSAGLGYLYWLPLYRYVPANSGLRTSSWWWRASSHCFVVFVGFLSAWFTFINLLGPMVTTNFGRPEVVQYAVTQKSSGRRVRRGCDHFITLYDRQSGWHGKICLRKAAWQSMQMNTMVEGVGRRSVLGRTVERLEQ